MSGDFNKPSSSSAGANVPAEIRDNQAELAKMSGSFSNLVVGVIRRNASTKKFEEWSGAGWVAVDLSGQDVGKVDGCDAGTAANNVLKLSSSALVPLANIPATLTGKDAASVAGKTPGAASGLATLDASSKVVQEPASKGQASGLASLAANGKLVQDAIHLYPTVSASGYWAITGLGVVYVVPLGVYTCSRINDGGLLTLDVYASGAWSDQLNNWVGGVIVSDGVNVRLRNTNSAGAIRVKYIKW